MIFNEVTLWKTLSTMCPPPLRRMLYSGHCSVAFGVFKICIFSEAGLKQKQVLFKNKAIDLFIYDNLNVIL